MKNRKFIILILMVFLFLIGCGKEDPKTITDSVFIYNIPDQYYTGEPIKPGITAHFGTKILTEGQDYELEYKNNIEVGTATIIVKSKSKSFSGSREVHFNIVDKLDISSINVSLFESVYIYEGKQVEPEYGIYGTDYGSVERDVDYTVEYANNDKPGDAEIIITGIGKYTGTKVVYFSIIVKDPEITCNPAEYTGKPLTIASCPGGKIIENETQINAGTYTVKCQSPYDSERVATKSCTILPRDISEATVTGINANYPVKKDHSPIYPTVNPTVTYDRNPLVEGTDYTLSYTNNDDIGAASVIVKGKGNFRGEKRVNEIFYIYATNCGKASQNFEIMNIEGNRDEDRNNMYHKSNNIWIDLCRYETAEIRYVIPAACTKFKSRVKESTAGEIKIDGTKGVKKYSDLITLSYLYDTVEPLPDGSIYYVLKITQNKAGVDTFFANDNSRKYTPIIYIGQTRYYKTEKYEEIKFSGNTLHVRIAKTCDLKANNLDKSAELKRNICCCPYKELEKCYKVNDVSTCPDDAPYEDISQKACSGTSTSTSTAKVCCCTTQSKDDGNNCAKLDYCLKNSYPYQDSTGERCNSSSSSTSTTTKKCCCSSKNGGSCMERNSCGGNYPFQDTTGRCK